MTSREHEPNEVHRHALPAVFVRLRFEVFALLARSIRRQNFVASRSTIASRRSWCGLGNAGRNLGIPKSSVWPNHSSFSFADSRTAPAHFMRGQFEMADGWERPLNDEEAETFWGGR